MQIIFLILLFVLGACFGSFLCCQARRLHYKAAKHKKLGSRSICLHCHHRLKWYDNLPLISWIVLKGKCRKCHRPIGLAEFLSEIGAALAFLALGTTIDVASATPLVWVSFCVTLLFTTVLIFLAIYDGIYGELPTAVLIAAIIISVAVLALKVTSILLVHPLTPNTILAPLASVLLLGGLYLFLYLISKGRWVGDGDWLLGTAIAIALFDPWLALVTLFLSNFLACLVMYPSVKGRKQKKIHFGPFLVVAFIIVFSLSTPLLSIVNF